MNILKSSSAMKNLLWNALNIFGMIESEYFIISAIFNWADDDFIKWNFNDGINFRKRLHFVKAFFNSSSCRFLKSLNLNLWDVHGKSEGFLEISAFYNLTKILIWLINLRSRIFRMQFIMWSINKWIKYLRSEK